MQGVLGVRDQVVELKKFCPNTLIPVEGFNPFYELPRVIQLVILVSRLRELQLDRCSFFHCFGFFMKNFQGSCALDVIIDIYKINFISVISTLLNFELSNWLFHLLQRSSSDCL